MHAEMKRLRKVLSRLQNRERAGRGRNIASPAVLLPVFRDMEYSALPTRRSTGKGAGRQRTRQTAEFCVRGAGSDE